MRRLAARMRVPRGLTTSGLSDRFGDPREVQPASGHVWRADWDGVARLVLLLTAEDRRWRVVPVSVEPTGEDERFLVAEASSTVFAVEVTAWAGLAPSIPTGTLSVVIDQWSPQITS
jgi:hypothetical protein